MNRISQIACISFAWAALSLDGLTVAQDIFGDPPAGGADIFGAPPAAGGDIFGGAAAAAPAAGANGAAVEELSINRDPLVEELRRYASGSESELAIAIRSAVQINEFQEAKAFLDTLGKRKLSDAQSADIVGLIRPNYLLRLQQHPSLTAGQRDQITKLIEAAKKFSEDRNRLQQQIARLDAPSPNDRIAAIGALRSGGLPAIAELAAAYVSDKPPARRRSIFDVLRRFDDDAADAMRQLALYGSPAVRAHAVDALMQLDLGGSIADLVAAYLGTDSSEAERQAAAGGLSQVLRGMPSLAEAEVYLGDRVELAIGQAQRVRNDDATRRVWQIGDDKASLTWQQLSRRLAFARDAADAASRLLRLPAAATEITLKALVADLAYRTMLRDDYGTAADYIARYGKQGATDSQRQLLHRALQESLRSRNDFAAIAAIRFLQHAGGSELVASAGAQPNLLVDTAMHPSPAVRYEAAIATSAINYPDGYSGSSELLHRWIEMSALQRRPTALLLEARESATRDKVNWLEAIGYAVEVVTSVADLQRRIESGRDIQLLVATSQPADRLIIETVDLIRRRPLGGSFPILIYCQPAKTLWDEDLRQPILAKSGEILVDVAGKRPVSRTKEETDRLGSLPPPRTTIRKDESLGRKFADLRAIHAVQEERLRLIDNLGKRWPAPIAVVEEIPSARVLAENIHSMVEELPSPPLSAAQRRYYADQGIAALLKAAKMDNPNNPYDFRSHEQEVTSAVQTGGFSETGLSLLSGFGTSDSQELLANLAASAALPEATRQTAAKAFADSVKRFGTRISRESVALQYERYNTAADQAGRDAVGTVLDAMEQHVQANTR